MRGIIGISVDKGASFVALIRTYIYLSFTAMVSLFTVARNNC